MNELDGLMLVPIVDRTTNALTQVRIHFKDAPGMYVVLSADAARELSGGITALLDTKNWDEYDANRK